ncbi:MAG: lysophospholipid acyltransferase family protein [Pseudomonadota bacterium]
MTADMQSPPESLGGPLQAIRGLLFIALMYLLLLVMGLLCLIPSKISRNWAMVFIHAYCDAVMWMLRIIVGTRCEVRGTPPNGACLVASKHQSFLDIIILTRALPRPAFVMKKSIRWVPVLGVYAERLGSIPIDRSDGGQAMKAMIAGAGAQAQGRQLIVFAQGTRVPPGVDAPFRPGVLRLREKTGLPITLAALNTGWFWPRVGIRRTPGTAVVEFLTQIDASGKLTIDEVAAPIEAASKRLADEAAAEIYGTAQ